MKESANKYNNTFSRSIEDILENVFSPSVFRVIEGDKIRKVDVVFSRKSERKVNKFNEISYKVTLIVLLEDGNIGCLEGGKV